ncbi:MAG: 30S ribosomal protein S5 [bacterium]|nr:30S ribosomal protein S5 [bacterium]MDZ4231809.1 30S ribosomal protein S5 [Candidatus Pacearchaeota archaeon]
MERRGPQQQRDQRGDRRPRRPREEKEFDSKLLDLARVTRVTGGGRKFRFRATIVIGDKKGRVGVGVAKGLDVAQAVAKASKQAEKALITVPMVDGTIPHEVSAKFGASKVLLRPQEKGRGLVAGGAVRVICEKAGIHDISAKFTSRTSNQLNNAMATIHALSKLQKPKP